MRSRFGTSAKTGEDAAATRLQRYGALIVAVLLASGATLAATFGRGTGPVIGPLIPITATVWSLADLLTALLMLTQFYTSGRALFGTLALAYGFNGLITVAYVAYFPRLFSSGAVTLGTEQISNSLWILWHCTFPALVWCAVVLDSRLHPFSRRTTALLTGAIAVGVPIGASAVALLVATFRNSLPHLVVHGTFEPSYTFAVLPLVAALNLCAALLLLTRGRLTPLRLWLAIATFAGCIDALLVDFSVARYSYVWDAGKLLTVFAGSVVLIMMLWDVIGMYGRLARVARVDALTSLKTRYVFEEQLNALLRNSRGRAAGLALLIVSVDSFARYGDEHGTVAGEECLRRIARELRDCLDRPLDLVARYGDADFAILMPDASLLRARSTAERIRSIVANLQIGLGRATFGRVTVSIGVSYASDAASVGARDFFDAAAGALQAAIRRGGNAVAFAAGDAALDEPEAALPDYASVLLSLG